MWGIIWLYIYIYIYFEFLDFYYLRVISSWQNSQMSLYGCDIVCNPIVLVALLSSVSWIPCCVACLIGRVWYRMQLFLSVSCQISSLLSVSYPLILHAPTACMLPRVLCLWILFSYFLRHRYLVFLSFHAFIVNYSEFLASRPIRNRTLYS